MKLDSSSLSSPSFHIQETDWILVVRGGGGGGSGETSTAQTVLQRLADRGWRFKVHKLGGSSTAAGSSSKLLFGIFVKCPPAVFKEEFVKQMAQAQAGGEMHSSISDLDTFLKNTIQPAQRLRITHYALTCPGYLGGLGFTTREEIDRTGFSSSMKSFAGDISDPSPPIVLEYIFSLHDQTFCKEWIYKWSHKLFLTESDLTDIRNMLGEKTAFYFAFLQYYTIFLIIPSAIGLYFSWSTPSNQRYIYGAFIIFWGTVFTNLWDRYAQHLSILWGTASNHLAPTTHSPHHEIRSGFRPSSVQVDAMTGEKIPLDSLVRRYAVLGIFTAPVIIILATLIASIVVLALFLELFISQYTISTSTTTTNSRSTSTNTTNSSTNLIAQLVPLLPTLLLVVVIPMITTFYNSLMKRLNDAENRPTTGAHRDAMTQKLFLVAALLGYFNLAVCSFVIIPFQDSILAWLEGGGGGGAGGNGGGGAALMGFLVSLKRAMLGDDAVGVAASATMSGPDTLATRLVFYLVTGQIINAVEEFLFPVGVKKTKELIEKRKLSRSIGGGGDGGGGVGGGEAKVGGMHSDEDQDYIKRAVEEMQRPEFDVAVEYSEMIVQYGYVMLFSVIWPFAPICCLVNNFLELRSDALKIAITTRRPVPSLDDNIGPWRKNISFLTWLGALTTTALLSLYVHWSPDIPSTTQTMERMPYMLAAVFFAEHGYFALQHLVKTMLASLPPPFSTMEKRRQFERQRQIILDLVDHDVAAGRWGGRVIKKKETTLDDQESVVDYGVALKRIHEGIKIE